MSKGVENRGVEFPKISQDQLDVLHLLTKEFLTPKRIAIRRKCSVSAVYKIIHKLKKKGLLRGGLKRGLKKSNPLPQIQPPRSLKKFKRYIRLHAQEWNIKLLWKSDHYDQLRIQGNLIDLDNNRIRLHNESLEIYSGKDFSAEDELRATALSFQYWNKFFVRLENHLKILIIKNRVHNISLVNSHYAEVDNELAREYEKKKIQLNIYAVEDGKLWFKIDNSFDLHEAETLHPGTAKDDMTKVRAHFNDIRSNEHIPLSRLSHYVADTQRQINEISHGLKIIVDILKPKEDPTQEKLKPDYMG